MEVKQVKVTIRDLFEGYADDGEGGVRGYGGRLDIRPPYQREFVYEDRKEHLRDAVIDSIALGYPINSMHWAVRGDGNFEMIDGQQRTISICRYVQGRFTVDDLFNIKEGRKFHTLDAAEKEAILGYEITVYQCSGSRSELTKWFRTINIAGEKLTEQEIRNAVYHGKWVTDAKRYFSKRGCGAQTEYGDYLSGSAIRQEYLETAIGWISEGKITEYMAEHQGDESARPLWDYMRAVFDWVAAVFPKYDKTMKGVDWGRLHRECKDGVFDADAMQKEIDVLMKNKDVEKKSGIYRYLLTGDDGGIKIRQFDEDQRATAHARQDGKCAMGGKEFPIEEMEADHIKPWAEGGKTETDNCQMLCRRCHARKTAQQQRRRAAG